MPLREAAAIEEARDYIMRAPEAHKDHAAVEVAVHIQSTVNRALRWDLYEQPLIFHDDFVEPHIDTSQTTNCIGYTLVTAELLSAAGIRNYFAHMGGHFMNVVPNQASGRPDLYMIDSFKPALSQNMGNSITDTTVPDIEEGMADPSQRRGVARIDTARFLSHLNQNPEEFTQREAGCTWMYYQKGNALHTNNYTFGGEERHYRNRYTRFMTVYSNETGQTVLPAYAAFLGSYGMRDTTIALQATQELAGLFPEIDARADHAEVKHLVRQLTNYDMFTEALDVIQNYCSSFTLSLDPRLKGLEAGLYCDIADATDDASFRGLAIKAYAEAQERARYRSDTYEGRIGRLRKRVLAGSGEGLGTV